MCALLFKYMFTFIAHKNHIFFLHNSQKYTTFALDLEKEVTITVKPGRRSY